MQKHQMHFRHEKETDQLVRLQVILMLALSNLACTRSQLCLLQEQKLSSLEKKFLFDQAKLPKKQRSAASTRKRELRKSLHKSERAQKLEEFDTLERTRMSAEEKVSIDQRFAMKSQLTPASPGFN